MLPLAGASLLQPIPGLCQLLPAAAPLQLSACRGDAALQQTHPCAVAGMLNVSPEAVPRAWDGASWGKPQGLTPVPLPGKMQALRSF